MNKLRILIVSNFYPPFHIGGYEIGCQRVARQLASRGHDLEVLTSSRGGYNLNDLDGSIRVRRILPVADSKELVTPIRLGKAWFALAEQYTRRRVKQTVMRFAPKVVSVWNPAGLYPGVLDEVRRWSDNVAFYISDEWPIIWRGPYDRASARMTQVQQNLLGAGVLRSLSSVFGTGCSQAPLEIRSAQFCSDYLRCKMIGEGIFVKNAEVLPWGVDRKRYFVNREWASPATRFLHAGQLSSHKGTHIALEAFIRAKQRRPNAVATLTLAGECRDEGYRKHLEWMIDSYSAGSFISWAGKLAEAEMQKAFREHDAFIFSSIWQEPYSIALVEAMTAGLATLSTATGGSAEIVENEVNSLVVASGNVALAVAAIGRLMDDVALCRRISRNAVAATAVNDLESQVNAIENFLSLCCVSVAERR